MASQGPKQEGTSQQASVVTSCFISLLHATGKTEISTTILQWWNGANIMGSALNRSQTWAPQPFVWKSRTRRWKVLLQSQLVSTMHCNSCARELPWKLFMRHPSVRSSSKIERCKESVTSQTNNCWPWKAPWRQRLVHKNLSPGSLNTLTGIGGLVGNPWWRSQSSARSFHWILSAARAMSNPWCVK